MTVRRNIVISITLRLVYLSILLNIMFHAPMGRFQLELIYYFTYFSTVVPSNICVFHTCRSFVFNTFSAGLVGDEVSSVSWHGIEETSTPTIPVENIVLTAKGLQDRNTQMLDGTTVEK